MPWWAKALGIAFFFVFLFWPLLSWLDENAYITLCNEHCQQVRQARAQRVARPVTPAYQPPQQVIPPAGGYAEANASGGHYRGWPARSRSGLRPDQEAFVQHNGLGRNLDTGFWEKQIVAPAGTPPPPQGWHRAGPGRGRYVCTAGPCLEGR